MYVPCMFPPTGGRLKFFLVVKSLEEFVVVVVNKWLELKVLYERFVVYRGYSSFVFELPDKT